jgi:tetratricopeptide (TPR) repeat protein
MLRERELGFSGEAAGQLAGTILRLAPSADWTLALHIAQARAYDGPTLSPERGTVLRTSAGQREYARWRKRYRLENAATPFEAYLALTLECDFAEVPGESTDLHGALVQARAAYPDAALIQYKVGTCRQVSSDLLEPLLALKVPYDEVHLFLARDAIRQGQLVTAEHHLRLARAAFPKEATADAMLASLYLNIDEFDQAIQACRDALDLLPHSPGLLMGLARGLTQAERPEEALDVLRALQATGSWASSDIQLWRARNLLTLSRLDDAAAAIGLARQQDPSQEVLKWSEIIAYNRKKYDDALTWFRAALAYSDQDCDVWFYGAASFETSGDASLTS